jgi:hypothetical protein
MIKNWKKNNENGVSIAVDDITESQILDLETLEFTDFLKTRFDRDNYWNMKWKKEF